VRAVVQRVERAKVTVDGEVTGEIGPGLCVFVGVTHSDTADVAVALASKLATLRIFGGDDGRMDLSLLDTGGSALVVSQFTLYGDARKGRRPSFVAAAPGATAEPLVQAVVDALGDLGVATATGRFGAHMAVELTNDGPVTLVVDLP